MTTTTLDRARLAGVCLVALLLRLLVIWACANAGLFSDMQDYYDRAIYLRDHGHLFPDAFRPPAFPALLAGLSVLFGDHVLLAARLVQALLGTASVWLTAAIAQRLAGPRAGLVAASILAVYPAWLLYSVYIMAETLFTFLMLLGLWLWTARRWWTAALAGVALALSVQARAVGVATIAAVALVAALDLLRRRQSRSPARGAPRVAMTTLACLLAAFAVTLAPWVVRNAQLFGAFIPTDTASGYNFLLGNNPLATGRLEIDQLPSVNATYWSRLTTDVQRHTVGMEAGMAFIRAEPGTAVTLGLRKMGYLVGLEGREHAWTYSYHYHGRRSPAVVWAWGLALLVSFPLVMITGMASMVRPGALDTSLGRTIIATLIIAAALHLASFGESRFHLPWVPLLAVMAGTLFGTPPTTPWSTRRRALLGIAIGALVALWITQAPVLLERLGQLAASPTPLGLPY